MVNEMSVEVHEGVVLLPTGAHNANDRSAIGGGDTIILSVAAGSGQLFYVCGLGSGPLLIKLYELLHDGDKDVVR